MVDTGADVTVLHPQDGLRLLAAPAIQALPNPLSLGGVGGTALYYPVDAILAFLDDDAELRTCSAADLPCRSFA